MRKIAFAMVAFSPTRAVLLTFVMNGSVACFAAGTGALESAQYRLSEAQTTSFRLAGEDRSKPSPPAALAEMPYAGLVESAARDAALDPRLVHALIYVESGYNQSAKSAKGALGLMQVLPETAARYGVKAPARSVEENLRAGTRYLRELMDHFDSRLELVLAAYNAGENAVLRYGLKVPPYRETQQYVPAVLAKYREWREPSVSPAPIRRRVEYLPGTVLRLDFRPDTQP